MVGNNWARMASMTQPFMTQDTNGRAAPRRRRKAKAAKPAAGPRRRKKAGPVRLKKGSAAAKAYMARIRKLRKR